MTSAEPCWNVAALHEAIGAAIPDRECIVFRDRRLSWADVTDRTRRLADVLRNHELGCRREREGLEPWESGQDHVGLLLYNGNEYLEGMLGAFKARCAPFNVNYRYVEDELLHLLRDADARAIVFHARFAPMLARIRDRLPAIRLWLQVEDGSGEPLLPGARDYEAALAAATPSPPRRLSSDDLYVLYTGGTTGLPKGVLWRHEDIFRAALCLGSRPASPEALVERIRHAPGVRSLPAPPLMHGAAQWVAFNAWHTGGTVVLPWHPETLDADDIWSTAERERVASLTIIGDAFARPLADQLDRKRYDLSSLRIITTGGALTSVIAKQRLLAQLPAARIIDALGASESGSQANHFSSAEAASTGRFALAAEAAVLAGDLSRVLEPGSTETGWLARCGEIPLGYYKDPEKTARTFPTVGGVRYSVPGDRCVFDGPGHVRLLGRDSMTINSGGEKIFAEEVEQALKHHADVQDAVVVGTPNERFGAQVTAVVALRAGATLDRAALSDEVRKRLAGFKVPRAYVQVDRVERAPSGKADYAWARRVALAQLAAESDTSS